VLRIPPSSLPEDSPETMLFLPFGLAIKLGLAGKHQDTPDALPQSPATAGAGKAPAVIVIPVYNEVPEEFEKTSVQQCLRVLGHYPIYFFARTGFDFKHYRALCSRHPNVQFVTFAFAEGVTGYNQLLTGPEFYKYFLSYKYLLIYHTDAFVFRDELPQWCAKGFDYVRAAMINAPMINTLLQHSRFLRLLYKLKLLKNVNNGCGGLSLRKVRSSYWSSQLIKPKGAISEDLFWSFTVPSRNPFFRVPSLEKACQFAYTDFSEQQYRPNGEQLPFGCHSWPFHDFAFWKPIIRRYGYEG